MATHHDSSTSALSNAIASFLKVVNIQQHNNNQQGYASSIQMGNQMQYAGQYVGNQMDQIVNQIVLNQNGIDCFMTSIQKPTSEIHRSDIGNNLQCQCNDKGRKDPVLVDASQ